MHSDIVISSDLSIHSNKTIGLNVNLFEIQLFNENTKMLKQQRNNSFRKLLVLIFF